MNRKLAFTLIALILFAVSCNTTTTSTTAPPYGFNSKSVNGSAGEPSIPVQCNTANGDVSVPAGAFSGTKTVSIECISQTQKNELTTLVKKKTTSTNVALGAVKLEPSPFTFNKDVTIVIPLDPQRYDLRDKKADVYVYAPDRSDDLLLVSQAQIDSQGLTAKAKTGRFSIFILVGPEEGVEEPEPPAEPPAQPPAGFTCEDPLGCIDVAPGDSIRIAGLLDFSGQGELSAAMWDGIRAAVSEYPTIGGFAANAETWDAGCNAEVGANAAYGIVWDSQIVGAIGTLCSSSASKAQVILSDAGYVMISPGNTRTSFTFTDRYPGYFRVATPDAHQAQVMARFAYHNLGARRVGIYLADAEFGYVMAETFSNQFRELGGEIIAYEAIPTGQSDMSEIASYIEESQMDAVYMPLFTAEAGNLALWVREYGVEIPLLGSDATNIPDLISNYIGDGTGNVFYTSPSPSVFTQPYAYGYDATRLLLEAIARIAIVDESGFLHIGRGVLRDALYNVSFSGQTGEIACDQRGDCGHAPIAIYLIKDGVPSEVARYMP